MVKIYVLPAHLRDQFDLMRAGKRDRQGDRGIARTQYAGFGDDGSVYRDFEEDLAAAFGFVVDPDNRIEVCCAPIEIDFIDAVGVRADSMGVEMAFEGHGSSGNGFVDLCISEILRHAAQIEGIEPDD